VFLEHFERLRPICPACRVNSALRIGVVASQENGEIVEGSLICTNAGCQREHPVIDGIPVLLADAPGWLAQQILGVMRREDLSPFTESLLGDLSGAGSGFDRERGNNGIYAHSHWAADSPSYVPLFDVAMGMLRGAPEGVWLDIGCSLGRGTFELARRSGQLAVGLDLNFSMLRMARRIQRTGKVKYAMRRVGLVFDTHEFEVAGLPTERVSFWCADVNVLPFASGTFDGTIAMNMLDCAGSPLGLLCEMGRVVKPLGESILCTPFDWAVGASAAGAWIGGHSQRSAPAEGSSVEALRQYLSGVPDIGLTLEAERDDVAWRLRVHERSVTEYAVYFAKLLRRA